MLAILVNAWRSVLTGAQPYNSPGSPTGRESHMSYTSDISNGKASDIVNSLNST